MPRDVDAKQSNPWNSLSNDDMTDMLKANLTRYILVIADFCYSGTLGGAAPANFNTWEDRRRAIATAALAATMAALIF